MLSALPAASTSNGGTWGLGAAFGLTGAASAAVTFGLSAAATAIMAIFAHHSAAVKNEANVLNYAVPGVEESLQEVVARRNDGRLSPAEASSAIDGILSQYSTFVYSHGVKQKAGNGPDVVLKDWLQPWAEKVKALLQSGGKFVSDPIPAHAGFAGLQPFELDIAPPVSSSPVGAAVATLNQSPALGIPWWLWIAAAILVIWAIR